MSTHNYDRGAARQGGANAGNTRRTAVFAFSPAQRTAIRQYHDGKLEEKRLLELVAVQVIKQQLACYLMYKAGLKIKQIGEITKLSHQAVRDRIDLGRIAMGEDEAEKTA